MNRKIFFSGFFWKFNEQISMQLVQFFVQIILARLLSPKDYGIVALVNVFIFLADVFVVSGFNTSLIQKKDSNEEDFSTIFYCSLFFSIFVYAVVYVLAPLISKFYNNDSIVLILRVFALKLPISSFNAIQQAYVAKKMAFKKIFVSTTLATLLSGMIGIFLAIMNKGVWALVAQYLSNTFFSTIVLFIQIPWRPKLIFSKKSAKSLLSYGWKVMMASFLGRLFSQLRTLLIGKYYSSASLAYYNRGMQFPDLISNNVDTTISTVLFPYMSQKSNSLDELKSITRRAMKTSTYLIMPLMFGLAVVSKPLILLLLTAKWLPSVPYMQCLCIANAFSTITNTNLQAIQASGRSDLLLRLELVKKPVFLLLLVIAIKIDVLAIAITMIIYSIYAAVVNMKPNTKIINYTYKEQIMDILPPLLMSMIMGSVVWFISLLSMPLLLSLILQILIGVMTYLGESYLFKYEPYQYLIGYLKDVINK
ncbi:lipopolysaccharide biosynthesis protein [Limosilactobacillus mucosae]|uniref:lipopolysaccharide biosynthesis protein n=1 Tax=Limosilactobacillus mucosae TaxID=97478 RepID=UPI00233EA9C8|nr:lipopolysaccharide biosynthesis protein [Limosilactobacillus mucosae]MDC2844908.1 lipopolysaccharide biosynthesis protein [Limosilactobacillus mucosae]